MLSSSTVCPAGTETSPSLQAGSLRVLLVLGSTAGHIRGRSAAHSGIYAGAVRERCGAARERRRAEDQQREHKSAKIPPGNRGTRAPAALVCAGARWCALLQCGPHGCSALWARPCCLIPDSQGSPQGPVGKGPGVAGSFHCPGSPSAAPETPYPVRDAVITGPAVRTQPARSVQIPLHGRSSAVTLQAHRVTFQFILLHLLKLNHSPHAAGVSKPLAGATGQDSGCEQCPKVPGCLPGPAKELSAPPSPTRFWSSL